MHTRKPRITSIEPHGSDIHIAKEEVERESEEKIKKIFATLQPLIGLTPHNPARFGAGEQIVRLSEQIAKLAPDSIKDRELRELALSIKEYERLVKKYTESLNNGLKDWEAKSKAIIDNIRALGDKAAGMYKKYTEYPLADNFNTHDEKKAASAEEYDNDMRLMNQAIAFYFWNVTEDLVKLVDVTNDANFKAFMHHLNVFEDKMRNKKDLEEAEKKCTEHARQARFQINQSRRQNEKSDNASTYIRQKLPNTVGIATPALRLTKLNGVTKRRKEAEARITELEQMSAYIERERQETEAKINAYIAQCEKRVHAEAESTERQNALYNPAGRRPTGLIPQARVRRGIVSMAVTDASNRATNTPSGNAELKDIADRMVKGTMTPADANMIYANAGGPAKLTTLNNLYQPHLTSIQALVNDSNTRSKKDEIRAKEADMRDRIAKAYNDPQISDKHSKDVKEHANKIMQMEKQIAENANNICKNMINIMEKYKYIHNTLIEMDKIRNANPFASELQQHAANIEEAGKYINNLANLEITFRRNIEDLSSKIEAELQREHESLIREHLSARAITTLANDDLVHLNNLVMHQRALEDILKTKPATGITGVGRIPPIPGLIEQERKHAEIMYEIEKAIDTRQRDLTNYRPNPGEPPRNLKTEEREARDEVYRIRTRGGAIAGPFEAALENLRATEEGAAPALKRNAIHMGQDARYDADQAIELLDKANGILSKDGEGVKNMDEFHFAIDPENGKYTIFAEDESGSTNAVWIHMREVEKFEELPPDPTTGEARTGLKLRPDITKIRIRRFARDSVSRGSDPDREEVLDTKRHEHADFILDGCHIIIDIPGNDFNSGYKRNKGFVLMTKNPDKIRNPAGPLMGVNLHNTYQNAREEAKLSGATDEDADEAANLALELEIVRLERIMDKDGNRLVFIKRIESMAAASEICVDTSLVNEKKDVEAMVRIVEKTTPYYIINHAKALKRRKNHPAFTPERMRHMHMGNLDRKELRLANNGLKLPFALQDLTETKQQDKKKEYGLTQVLLGPPELSKLNLQALSRVDAFTGNIQQEMIDLKQNCRGHLKTGIELIKQSVRSYDTDKIHDTLRTFSEFKGTQSYQLNLTRKELSIPPKTRFNLEDLRAKKKAEKKARLPQWVEASIRDTAKTVKAVRSYENKVKESIRSIHQTNPLSTEAILLSRTKVEDGHIQRYAIHNHPSSIKKHELLRDIEAANGLDKRIAFPLLVDPELGPSSPPGVDPLTGAVIPPTGSAIKNANPNGLELLQEYNLYKDKQDSPNVKQYCANIVTAVENSSTIPISLKNALRLELARDAANEKRWKGKRETDGTYKKGVIDYIRALQPGDCPTDSECKNSLVACRQRAEYQWTRYLLNALPKGDAELIPEGLEQALEFVHGMQVERFDNLERAKKALNLETPSGKALEILGKIKVKDRFKPWSGPEIDQQEKANVDLKDKNNLDPREILKKSDQELAKDAGAVAETLYRQAIEEIDDLIKLTTDPVIQQRYREAAVQLTLDLAKQKFEIHRQERAIKLRWEMLEEHVKQARRFWWGDLWKDLALHCLKNLTALGSKDAQTFINKLFAFIDSVPKL